MAIEDILGTAQDVSRSLVPFLLERRKRKREDELLERQERTAMDRFERESELKRELLQQRIEAEKQRGLTGFEQEKELLGLKQQAPAMDALRQQRLSRAEANKELAQKSRIEQKLLRSKISKVKGEKGAGWSRFESNAVWSKGYSR